MADPKRRREYFAALGTVAVALVIAWLQLWPVPNAVASSLPHMLVGDRVLIGLLRLALLLGGLYFIASVPVLVVGGRWAKGAGTSGILADDPRPRSSR